jgi:hypothetical protein
MSTGLTRAIAWLYAAAPVFLTLGSPRYRFETVLPHNVEHLVAFSNSGLLFSFGYRSALCLLHWPASALWRRLRCFRSGWRVGMRDGSTLQ